MGDCSAPTGIGALYKFTGQALEAFRGEQRSRGAEAQIHPTNSDKMPLCGGLDNNGRYGLGAGFHNLNGYDGHGWPCGGNAGAIYYPGAWGGGNVGGIYGQGNVIIINNYSCGNLDSPVRRMSHPCFDEDEEEEEEEEEDGNDEDEDEEEEDDEIRLGQANVRSRLMYHI
ncbi:uncharacterized protein [Elaeis guineensis]|uniref:uncharacterized protein isoform X3 n=1 Tax=Elaeis guineensis var. tenera TaxID=51953 RepID=UPI003C6CCCFF